MKYIITAICAIISMMHPVKESSELENGKSTLSQATISYIDQYKEIAVAEMYRSGIPASIILAQGICESGNGLSELAMNSNNHFGIKCKSYWKGNTYFHKDDDYNDKGILTESCFRAYNEVIDSYVDHSNFLMYTSHYSVLFQYERTDYVNWAHGLKACGYATDKAYAQKLIDKIQLYDLHSFDLWQNPFELLRQLKDSE